MSTIHWIFKNCLSIQNSPTFCIYIINARVAIPIPYWYTPPCKRMMKKTTKWQKILRCVFNRFSLLSFPACLLLLLLYISPFIILVRALIRLFLIIIIIHFPPLATTRHIAYPVSAKEKEIYTSILCVFFSSVQNKNKTKKNVPPSFCKTNKNTQKKSNKKVFQTYFLSLFLNEM